MANKNRDKGHRFERYIANLLKDIYPRIQTARYASRITDDNGIDFVNTGSVDIQAKTLKSKPNFKEVFEHMMTDRPKLFIYKDNKIIGKSGEYAVMPLEDMITLLRDLDG